MCLWKIHAPFDEQVRNADREGLYDLFLGLNSELKESGFRTNVTGVTQEAITQSPRFSGNIVLSNGIILPESAAYIDGIFRLSFPDGSTLQQVRTQLDNITVVGSRIALVANTILGNDGIISIGKKHPIHIVPRKIPKVR